MARKIVELFGYSVADTSAAAIAARQEQSCPFADNKPCTKEIGSSANRIRSGVCSIAQGNSTTPVVICPIRLYAEQYKLLSHVAKTAFRVENVILFDGRQAKSQTPIKGATLVAVFGKGWGGELKVPGRAVQGRRATGFFVDWILARLDERQCLLEFAALEVQTMDTIGSYRAEREAALNNTAFSGKSAGPNWENVNKRILPQLIYKGHLLEREALCRSGLFFACPQPVYEKILDRLGSSLADYPINNSTLTFVPIQLGDEVNGKPRSINFLPAKTTTVQQVQIAFSSPTNLPAAGAYEHAIRAALGETE